MDEKDRKSNQILSIDNERYEIDKLPKEIQELIELYFTSLLTSSPKTMVHAPQPPSEHPSLVPVFFNSVLI